MVGVTRAAPVPRPYCVRQDANNGERAQLPDHDDDVLAWLIDLVVPVKYPWCSENGPHPPALPIPTAMRSTARLRVANRSSRFTAEYGGASRGSQISNAVAGGGYPRCVAKESRGHHIAASRSWTMLHERRSELGQDTTDCASSVDHVPRTRRPQNSDRPDESARQPGRVVGA